MTEKIKNKAVRNYTIYAVIGTVVELVIMLSVLLFLLPAIGMDLGIIGRAIIIGIMLSFSLFTYLMGRKALGQKYMHDVEAIIGTEGRVLESFDHKGFVKIGNEYWNAISTIPLEAGTEVVVTSIQGLRIYVAPLSGKDKPEQGANIK